MQYHKSIKVTKKMSKILFSNVAALSLIFGTMMLSYCCDVSAQATQLNPPSIHTNGLNLVLTAQAVEIATQNPVTGGMSVFSNLKSEYSAVNFSICS